MKPSRVPAATVNRLSLYLRALERLQTRDVKVISSEQLAERCRVNPAQVRKDLAYFGEFGVRGVGYYTNELLSEISKILGLNRSWNLALIGMGNLGSALVAHQSFANQGYHFVAVFDKDARKIGRRVSLNLAIDSINDIVETCRKKNVAIGVVATPPDESQDVVDLLVTVPVKAILILAPVQVKAPPGIMIEHVDFTTKLDTLAFHLTSH